MEGFGEKKYTNQYFSLHYMYTCTPVQNILKEKDFIYD